MQDDARLGEQMQGHQATLRMFQDHQIFMFVCHLKDAKEYWALQSLIVLSYIVLVDNHNNENNQSLRWPEQWDKFDEMMRELNSLSPKAGLPDRQGPQ